MSDMIFGVNLVPLSTSTYVLGTLEAKWDNINTNKINGVDVSELGGGGSTALSLNATAAGWSNTSPATQTLTATGVTVSNNIIVGVGGGLTKDQYEAAAKGQIACTAQAANKITLTAYGSVPSIDIPIQVLIM